MQPEVGNCVRYEGLGAGRVADLVQRRFQGKQTTFVVLHFPHQEMTVQLPLDDPRVLQRMHPIISQRKLRTLVRSLATPSEELPARQAEERLNQAQEVLRHGGPEDWAELLRAYAHSKRLGHAHLASDMALAREAQEMLAAEMVCASGRDFTDCLDEVKAGYRAASS